MRFLILGGGMQGRACAYDLLANPRVEEVLLADSSEKSLGEARRFLGDKRVKTARADAGSPARIKRLMKGKSAAVSCVPYFFNLPLAKAAIAARTHFVDLGGNTDIVLKELALDAQARRAGVSIRPDVGLGPGMTTTLAVHGMEKLDETREVHIRDGGLPQDPRPPLNYLLTFSEHGLINEYVEPAWAIREGRRVRVPGLSETEEIDLPPPLGRCEAAHASGGLSTMAWTFAGKVRTMDCKLIRYPGHIAAINAMNALGFFSQVRRKVGRGSLAPRELAAQLFREHFHRPGDKDLVVIRVTVRGLKDGRPAEVVHEGLDYFDEKTGMTAMMRTTGFPASIVAQMLASGALRQPGALPVETGVPTEPFLREAARRGFKLSWRLRAH